MARRALLDGLQIHLIDARRSVVDRAWRWRDIVSRFARLYLVHDGHALVRHGGREHALRPGRLHWIPAGERCDYRCPGRLDHTWIHCTAALAGGAPLDRVLRLPAELPATAEHGRLLARAVAAWTGRGQARVLVADACVRLVLADLVAAAETRADEPFAAILATIDERLAEPIRTAELASLAGWSPTWFANRFSERFGMGPRAWIQRRRLARAAELLRSGELRVEAVARAVGIADRSSFSRQFARQHRMSPQAWRRQWR